MLIADASRLFRRGRAQNFLELEHAAEILGWYQGFCDVPDAARVVSLDEIKAEDWTLNISRYVLPPLQEDILLYLRLLRLSKMHLTAVARLRSGWHKS